MILALPISLRSESLKIPFVKVEYCSFLKLLVFCTGLLNRSPKWQSKEEMRLSKIRISGSKVEQGKKRSLLIIFMALVVF